MLATAVQKKTLTSQADWAHFYHLRLQKMLEETTCFVTQHRAAPAELFEHMPSIFHLLDMARLSPAYHQNAARLILAFHPWPMQWGKSNLWQEQLRFACQVFEQNHLAREKIEAGIDLAGLLYVTGQVEQALELAEQALREAEQAALPEWMGKAASTAGYALISLNRQAEAAALIGRMEEQLQSMGSRSLRETEVGLAYLSLPKLGCYRLKGQRKEAITLASQLIKKHSHLPDPDLQLVAGLYSWRGVVYWADGQDALALADLDAQILNWISPSDLLTLSSSLANRALVYSSLGRLEQAETDMRRAVAYAEQMNSLWSLTRQVGCLGWILLLRGQFAGALMYVNRHIQYALGAGDQAQMLLARINRGTIRNCLGEYRAALDDLLPVLEIMKDLHWIELTFEIYINLAVSTFHLEGREKALPFAQQALLLAQQGDLPRFEVGSLRCLALCLPPEEAKEALGKALQQALCLNRPLDVAACRMDLIAFAASPEEAKGLWKEAATGLRQMGAGAWLHNHSPLSAPRILINT